MKFLYILFPFFFTTIDYYKVTIKMMKYEKKQTVLTISYPPISPLLRYEIV